MTPEPKTFSEAMQNMTEEQGVEIAKKATEAQIASLEPKTDEVENLILQFTEEFISDRGYGVGPQYVPAQFDFSDYTDWLRTTLQTQADRARGEREIQKIIMSPSRAGSTAHGINLET